MPSYANAIGEAVKNIIRVLPAAPTTYFRKENVVYDADTFPIVVITIGLETPVGNTFGGSILKTYTVAISIYRENVGNLTSLMDQNVQFVLMCKQALDGTSLVGVPVVWSVDIIEASEWEDQPFGQGAEVSTFGLNVQTAELRNF